MWIDALRRRASEVQARLLWRVQRRITRLFQPLWRRLGDYCDCRHAELAELGAHYFYPPRLGRVRKSYDVDTTRLLATPPRDNPIARRRGFVVRQTEIIGHGFVELGTNYNIAVLCSCDRWRLASITIGPPAVGNTELEDQVNIHRWFGIRTFSSRSLAEQQIGQIINRTSPMSRTKGRMIMVLLSIIASLIAGGIIALVT